MGVFKMTFTETLSKLYNETEHTQIYALISYGDAKCGIGFRRSCYESPYRDPIVDDVVFMICADAYYKDNYMPINTMIELTTNPIENTIISLRAQGGTYPLCTVSLGDFKINSMKIVEKDSNDYYPCRIHIDISRIH
jgi:hypothetical protein